MYTRQSCLLLLLYIQKQDMYKAPIYSSSKPLFSLYPLHLLPLCRLNTPFLRGICHSRTTGSHSKSPLATLSLRSAHGRPVSSSTSHMYSIRGVLQPRALSFSISRLSARAVSDPALPTASFAPMASSVRAARICMSVCSSRAARSASRSCRPGRPAVCPPPRPRAVRLLLRVVRGARWGRRA